MKQLKMLHIIHKTGQVLVLNLSKGPEVQVSKIFLYTVPERNIVEGAAIVGEVGTDHDQGFIVDLFEQFCRGRRSLRQIRRRGVCLGLALRPAGKIAVFPPLQYRVDVGEGEEKSMEPGDKALFHAVFPKSRVELFGEQDVFRKV